MDSQALLVLEEGIFLEFTIIILSLEAHRTWESFQCTLWTLLCPDQLLTSQPCVVEGTFFLQKGIMQWRIRANHLLSFRSQCSWWENQWFTNTMHSDQDFWLLSETSESLNMLTDRVSQQHLSMNVLIWLTLLFWWNLLWFFSCYFLKVQTFLKNTLHSGVSSHFQSDSSSFLYPISARNSLYFFHSSYCCSSDFFLILGIYMNYFEIILNRFLTHLHRFFVFMLMNSQVVG